MLAWNIMFLDKILVEKIDFVTGVVDPDPHWEYGFRRAKMTHKSEDILSFEALDVLF